MSGPPGRETIFTSLLNAIAAGVEQAFLADTKIGSPILLNPAPLTADSGFITSDSSLLAGDGSGALFLGLPVSGPGIPDPAYIVALSPLTISAPCTAAGTQVLIETGFQTTGRRVIPWKKCSAQPALFVRDAYNERERYEYPGDSILPRRSFGAEVWLYTNAAPNPDFTPAAALNYLLDAVEVTLAPDDVQSRRFTIGGLVEWARIAEVEKFPGDLDAQAIAIMTLEIIVP